MKSRHLYKLSFVYFYFKLNRIHFIFLTLKFLKYRDTGCRSDLYSVISENE